VFECLGDLLQDMRLIGNEVRDHTLRVHGCAISPSSACELLVILNSFLQVLHLQGYVFTHLVD